MCIGHTMGEESLFKQDQGQLIKRTESVVSKDYSCVLQLSVKTYESMK